VIANGSYEQLKDDAHFN